MKSMQLGVHFLYNPPPQAVPTVVRIIKWLTRGLEMLWTEILVRVILFGRNVISGWKIFLFVTLTTKTFPLLRM